MRRESDLFYKNKKLALLCDCVYYCWQNHQLTDEESNELENFIGELNNKVDYE